VDAVDRSPVATPRKLCDTLDAIARGLLYLAVIVSMTTPRLELGALHVNPGDVIALSAWTCWFGSWAAAPARVMTVRGALWPSVLLAVGGLSAFVSLDTGAVVIGAIELMVLWVLPAVAVPNLLSRPSDVDQFLLSISVGSCIAGVANTIQALKVGSAGGLPQVWGAAQYLQGYFQVLGLVIALCGLIISVASRRVARALFCILAGAVNAFALLLTETRGAWFCAAAAFIVMGVAWRRRVLVGGIGALIVVMLVLWNADWAEEIRQRIQSMFTLEAGLSGFESSLGRLALAVTAWRIFIANPLLGIGLKNFAIAMPLYAPTGMPLAYEMGPNHVLTAVEGPHSTYLSLLAEVGVFGLIAFLWWEGEGLLRTVRQVRLDRLSDASELGRTAVVLAGLTVVAIFNCFFEMNQTGTLVFVALLAIPYRLLPSVRDTLRDGGRSWIR